MRFLAKTLSLIFHPLFILSYVLVLLLMVNPYLFVTQDEKYQVLIVFSIFMLSVVFPLLSIAILKLVGLIDSFEMKTPQERIGPYVLCGMFYMWLFITMNNNTLVPQVFSMFILGATISLFVAFFINNFSKISLHTVGLGGMVFMVFVIHNYYSYGKFYVDIFLEWNVVIDFKLILYLTLIIAGLVGTSRLFLKAHSPQEIYGGYLVGFIGQLIAFRFLFEN